MNKTVFDELNKLKRNQQFLAIMALLFVCVLLWTGVSLLSSQQKTVIPAELTKLATPLTPVIDTEVIDRIEEKRTFSQSELQDFTIYRFLTLQNSNERVITTLDTTLEELNLGRESARVQSSPASTVSATPSPSPEPVVVVGGGETPTPSPTPSPPASPENQPDGNS